MKIKLSELKSIIEEEIFDTIIEQELQEMFGLFKSKEKPKELPDELYREPIVGTPRTFVSAENPNDANTEVKMSEISKKLSGTVVFKVFGNGWRDEGYEQGKVYKLSQKAFDTKFAEINKNTQGGERVNVFTIDPDLPTPADMLRRQGLSEGLQYHISEKLPLTESVYRVGSEAYFNIIKEAKEAYAKGDYTPINEEEKEMLNSDLGEWVMFEGERVPLDFPMYEETLEEAKKKKKKKDPPIGKPTKNTGGGKKYKVFVRNPKTGKIKKITYGDSKGGLKGNWNSAEARASFASRHNCAEKKDRTKAGYWACRAHKDFGTNVPGRFW